MNKLWNSFKIAFAMYSKIPMPYSDWKKENMQYSMCFFPLIGIVIGGLIWLWSKALVWLPLDGQLGTVVYLLIPLFITGGIHFDGFLDTQDALNSHQSKEKKLEILKDPHTGAFAIISGIAYYLLAFGIWSEVGPKSVQILSVGFVLSRALSGLSVVSFRLAKNSGLAATFSESAQKKKVKITMYAYLLLCAVLMLFLQTWLAVAAIIIAAVIFFYYRHVCYKEFGGMSGDLAGYFLQLCELGMAFAVILVERFAGI